MMYTYNQLTDLQKQVADENIKVLLNNESVVFEDDGVDCEIYIADTFAYGHLFYMEKLAEETNDTNFDHSIKGLKAFKQHIINSTDEMLDKEYKCECMGECDCVDYNQYAYEITMNGKTITLNNNADTYENVTELLNYEIGEYGEDYDMGIPIDENWSKMVLGQIK